MAVIINVIFTLYKSKTDPKPSASKTTKISSKSPETDILTEEQHAGEELHSTSENLTTHKTISHNTTQLNCIYTNAIALKNKWNEFKALINSCNSPHLVSIMKTWFDSNLLTIMSSFEKKIDSEVNYILSLIFLNLLKISTIEFIS